MFCKLSRKAGPIHHESCMQADQVPHEHRAVHGLPASLLAIEGRTFAVIELMTRQAGLNRERRREMSNGARIRRDVADRLGSKIPKSEMGVLSCYLSPDERFGSFWYAVKRMLEPQGARGSRAYSAAVDIQLLDAYEPQWLRQTLDEQLLTEVCAEWPRIRSRVEGLADPKNGKPPLGVFMLWPRIVDDLRHWGKLGQDRRLVLAHAAFALSSVGRSDWFVREALRICPDLDAELAPVLRRPVAVPAKPVVCGGAGGPDSSASSVEGGVEDSRDRSEWSSLLLRLDELTDELKERPSREAVMDLAALVRDMEGHCESLPQRTLPVVQQLNARLDGLMGHLRSLATRGEFQWLDPELVSQIEARWQLAVRERVETEQIEELAVDAAAAVQRSDAAAAELLSALAEVAHSHSAVADAHAALEKAKGFAEQAAGKRRRGEALRQQLEAEARQQARQESLIDAASPFSEPFDHSCDYRALLDGRAPPGAPDNEAKVSSSDSGLADPGATGSAVEDPAEDRDTTPEFAPAPDAQPTSEPEPARQAAAVFQQSLVDSAAAPQPDVPAIAAPESVNEERHADEHPYNDVAGQACRPIWQLLSCGQPALAFHAAGWIGGVSPELKVPSPDLLAAVALESALMLPDGGVQLALSARFERLKPEDFATQTPKTWHAAVNLLLASATMRAMVIAPGTGASSVAGYLHQDGSYPALYALVQQLRELSLLLMGFRIDPTVLRQARGEAAIRAELEVMQRAAEDWLRVQAPAYTIKFAAATDVWKQWLHAGGPVESLVAPVVHNRVAEADRVREQLAVMSDHDHVLRLIHRTDRKTLKRRRGEDIHSGALDHLLRNVDEALKLPRQWLGLVDLLGQQGDRLRDLLEQVHARLRDAKPAVERELLKVPQHDPWGLVQAGQAQALRSMHGVLALFDAAADLPSSEPPPAEVLGRPLLLLGSLSVKDDWTSDALPPEALESLGQWLEAPLNAEEAAHRRLERGDVLGAEMLVQAGMTESQSLPIRQDRERWKQALRKELVECRRSVEVGSAYGYLVDADRGEIESRLAQWEAQLDDVRRFDLTLAEIRTVRDRVDRAREVRAQQVRDAMRDVMITDELRSTAADVEQALGDGDIATANELAHWLVQGSPVPTELDRVLQEGFDNFFPVAMQAIETWLASQRRDAIEQALRQGQSIPGLHTQPVASAQREQAAKMFGAWSDMKAQQGGAQSRLELLLTGMGLTVNSLSRTERVTGREVWALDTQPVEDRHICPLPLFGSAANGRYRVVCVWGRPTEDELLQWVGDSTVNRPTFLLYFGRMTERKWRDLGRLSKTKRRSFVLLDETLLVYLCHAAGSRLCVWFDASLPFSFSSPYDATAGLVPPEMFYGRGAELDAVRGPNGRCFIYGGRQLGKTALLKRAEQSFHSPASGH